MPIRKQHKFRLADDVAFPHEPPVRAIERMAAVVAQHEIVVAGEAVLVLFLASMNIAPFFCFTKFVPFAEFLKRYFPISLPYPLKHPNFNGFSQCFFYQLFSWSEPVTGKKIYNGNEQIHSKLFKIAWGNQINIQMLN